MTLHYISTDKGAVVTRTTVKELKEPDSIPKKEELAVFDGAIREILGPTEDSELNNGNKKAIQNDRRKEALKVARREHTNDPNNADDKHVCNRHVIYDITDGDEHNDGAPGLTVNDFHDNEPINPDNDPHSQMLMGSEVLLSQNGVKERAKVISCKRNQDGNVIDTPPEEMEYLVEFPDGDQQVHEYNALLNAIYIQTDEDGNEW